MTTENLVTARNKVENVYELINDLVSNHSIDMLDLAYPKNDGKQDAFAVAEMMLLRQSANSLSEELAASLSIDSRMLLETKMK